MNALLSWKFSLILRICSKIKLANNDKRPCKLDALAKKKMKTKRQS